MLASFALRHLCPILSRDKHSLEFVVTLLETMKRFAGGSSSDSVVISLIGRQSAVTVKIRTYERRVDETTTATVYSWSGVDTQTLCQCQ